MLTARLHNPPNPPVSILAIVDSGADASTFHVDIAARLGIDLATCRAEQRVTAGGPATVYVCSVRLEVEGKRFDADVDFNPALHPTVALLGRHDVFRQFQLGFDQRALHLLVQPYP